MVAWKLWTGLPHVALWEAVALVMELDPRSLRPSQHGWMAGPSRGPIFEQRSFPSREKRQHFDDALDFAERAANAAGPIHLRIGLASGMNKRTAQVSLTEVVAFFVGVEWPDIPPPLLALVSSGASVAPAGGDINVAAKTPAPRWPAEAPVPRTPREGAMTNIDHDQMSKGEMAAGDLARNRQPQTDAEKAEEHRDWWDATMDADHWFSLADVDPVKAAMLLCRFNPNSETLAESESNSTDETVPRDFLKLRQRFEDLSRTEPRFRSLHDWFHAVKKMQARYHSWIDEYVDAVALLNSTPPPAPATAATPNTQATPSPPTPSAATNIEPAPAGAAAVVRHLTNEAQRRDILDPVIELAQSKCHDPTDTAQVLAQLQVLAHEEHPPLLASTTDGIKYTKMGEPAYLTRDALNKRLHPEKRQKRR